MVNLISLSSTVVSFTIGSFLERMTWVMVRRVDVYSMPMFLQSDRSINNEPLSTTCIKQPPINSPLTVLDYNMYLYQGLGAIRIHATYLLT